MDSFPSLDGFGPTRATLHAYALAINSIARVHAQPRPHWWHTSLKITEDGLVSDPLLLPSGESAVFTINFRDHEIALEDGSGHASTFPMSSGWSGTQMGDALIAAAEAMGLHGEYDRERFESTEPGMYDTAVAERFFTALCSAKRVFEAHLATLSGTISPIELWPHNFDMSAEWYGTRMIPYDEEGKTTFLPAQLNLGFYPGENDEDSYFYSNPWPFESELLLDQPLPAGANWHTDGWTGSELPYSLVVAEPHAEQLVIDFARAVYALARPTLID